MDNFVLDLLRAKCALAFTFRFIRTNWKIFQFVRMKRKVKARAHLARRRSSTKLSMFVGSETQNPKTYIGLLSVSKSLSPLNQAQLSLHNINCLVCTWLILK